MAQGASTNPLGRCPDSHSSASLLVGEGQIHPTMVDSPRPLLFHQRTGVLCLAPPPRVLDRAGTGSPPPPRPPRAGREPPTGPRRHAAPGLSAGCGPCEVGPAVSSSLRGWVPLVSPLLVSVSALAAGPVRSARRHL
ncbi:hypothetical protein NDU88_007553 [Pleurodeles waltl]|uniref:Uncharacterized protein n=1 Tax=Pleurodeles waltl TaxID=8319 RepID=A0AAV7NTM0_PLEWA|nr:hypothetical protein NDU88_007553 [Pleurodeles waltl]